MPCINECEDCEVEVIVIEINISQLFKEITKEIMEETFLESWAMSPNQAKALQVAKISDRHIGNLDAEFCIKADPFKAIELY